MKKTGHVATSLVLLLLCLMYGITYIDRVNISVTARHMMPALGLTEQQMGFVFSAFVIGYALFQIPGGWLGDRWGARIILTLALLWWSVFTAWTAMAPASPLAGWLGIMGALALARFLLGVGEAVALPNFNRIVTDWLPAGERGLGIGIAIDYSLLVVNRYRDERRRGIPHLGAVGETMAHAGRTIVFSALAVSVGLAVLLVLPVPFLRGFGVGGLCRYALDEFRARPNAAGILPTATAAAEPLAEDGTRGHEPSFRLVEPPDDRPRLTGRPHAHGDQRGQERGRDRQP